MAQLSGKVEGVFIARIPESMVSERRPQVQVTFEGFVGDRHAGMVMRTGGRNPRYPRGTEIRNSRQVSICSQEELEQIAANLSIPMVQSEWLGANLTLSGIPRLTLLPPSTRLYFANGVTLAVEAENLPCTHAGEVIQEHYPDILNLAARFPKAAMHLRGVVAWVEKPGVIREGETVQVEIPKQILYEL